MIASFGKFGNSFISIKDVTTPSNVPNCESIPNVNSIRKNNIAQKFDPGN